MTARKLALAIGLGLVVFASQCSVGLAQRGGGNRGGQQGPGGPGGPGGGMFGRGGGSPVDLALREDVSGELKLTEAQTQSLEQLNQQQQEQRREQMQTMRDRFQGLQDLSEEERQQRFNALREEQAKQQQVVRKQVEEILNPSQRTRFAQLGFQYYLQRGAIDQAIAAAGIELTEADQAKMRDAQQQIQQRIQEQIADIQRKAQEEILATVVSSQKVQELTGDAFEFTSGRGGPGGPNPRLGGNRPGQPQGDARPARPEADTSGGRRGRRQ